MYRRSCQPIALEKNAAPTLFLKRSNHCEPRRSSGLTFLGYAMSSSTARRFALELDRKSVPNRRRISESSHANPPRIDTFAFSVASFSASMKSMNSGAFASVALPERSSLGMTMSASTRTVRHSCDEKNFGA